MENGKQPAHPVQINNDVDVHNYGLTKREYFAAMAMQGLLNKYQGQMVGHQGICKAAIEYADELLKQLENESK